MKKTIATALIASMLASTGAAVAQEIQPLNTTASSQGLQVFGLGAIPAGAVVIGGFVILAGVIIGVASDGT